MNEDDIAHYLQQNPRFFDTYAELLADIQIPSPHGGQAISLADRQVASLRDKFKALETKLAELLQFGEENDAISEKMHRLALALLAAPSKESLLAVLASKLRDDLAVPHVAARLWGLPRRELEAEGDEYGETSEEMKIYAATLDHPYCGASANSEAAGWFGSFAGAVRSVALVPLRESSDGVARGACIGLLALGSEDPNRFYADMGTLYLDRLGQLASAGLARFA